MSTDAPTTEIPTGKPEIPVTRVHAQKEGYVSEEDYQKIKEEEKKQEEAKALKEAQFAKDPDMFIHVDEVVVASLRGQHGISVMIGRCARNELELALTRMQYRVMSAFQMMDMQTAMKQKGLIETPPESGKIIV